MKYNICDMHCDTITKMTRYPNATELLFSNDSPLHITFPKLMNAGYMAQCFAIFINLKKGNPFLLCNQYIDLYNESLAKATKIVSEALNSQDIMNNSQESKISSILTIEEGGVLEGKIDNLTHFYNRHVRMMTLTWNYPNELGYPNIDLSKERDDNTLFTRNKNDGLTPFGIEVIKKMNELGMIIDVSHLSDQGFYDVLKYTTKPIVASHSNSSSVHNVARNLDDDMIKALHQNGGIMGINLCPDFISFNKDDQTKDIIKHIKHIIRIGGIETCAIGTDFDGIPTPNGISDCSKMPLLLKALKDEGLTDEEIEQICYKNFLRVFKANCG